jgi:glycosyltransferase involved in cell wall biosynthesis
LDLAESIPEQEFLLIGPAGNDEKYYEQITDRAESIDNIDYLGRVDPEKIHDYYRNAIALVNTSQYEGFPNTFLEAWRFKTPVISLSVNPNRFIDSTATSGYAEDDFDELVRITRSLVQNPEQSSVLVESAYEYFQEQLTIESTSKQYSAVLDKI